MNPTSITSWLRKFSTRRGLPHINPHVFRHSVASILISEGTDIVTVSKQLGHSQVSTTGDIYSHVIEEAKAQATECIADVMLRRKQGIERMTEPAKTGPVLIFSALCANWQK